MFYLNLNKVMLYFFLMPYINNITSAMFLMPSTFVPEAVKLLYSKSKYLITLFYLISSPSSKAVLGPIRFPSNSTFSMKIF